MTHREHLETHEKEILAELIKTQLSANDYRGDNWAAQDNADLRIIARKLELDITSEIEKEAAA